MFSDPKANDLLFHKAWFLIGGQCFADKGTSIATTFFVTPCNCLLTQSEALKALSCQPEISYPGKGRR